LVAAPKTRDLARHRLLPRSAGPVPAVLRGRPVLAAAAHQLPKSPILLFRALLSWSVTKRCILPWDIIVQRTSNPWRTPGAPHRASWGRCGSVGSAAAGFGSRWKIVQYSASSKYFAAAGAGLPCPWRDDGRLRLLNPLPT